MSINTFSQLKMEKNQFETVKNTANLCKVMHVPSYMDTNNSAKTDLDKGMYEGGYKCWECGKDLAQWMEMQKHSQTHSQINMKTVQKVLELGCGHAMPGIWWARHMANDHHTEHHTDHHTDQLQDKIVVLQDFNEQVIEQVTRVNVELNQGKTATKKQNRVRIELISGAWEDPEMNTMIGQLAEKNGGYDLIMTADTIYEIASLPALLGIIVRHLAKPHGTCFIAAKRFYFGVGGGINDMMEVLKTNAEYADIRAKVVHTVDDGRSNVRDIVKLEWRA